MRPLWINRTIALAATACAVNRISAAPDAVVPAIGEATPGVSYSVARKTILSGRLDEKGNAMIPWDRLGADFNATRARGALIQAWLRLEKQGYHSQAKIFWDERGIQLESAAAFRGLEYYLVVVD